MFSQDTARTSTPTEDELHAALSNRYCRFVLHYFSDASESAASVADLSTAVAHEKDTDEDKAVVRLHHVALPKLSSIGVVDYDAANKTVSYLGHSHLEGQLRIGESEPEYVVAVQ
ncbi:hypothetical protein [Halobacterium sp. R2-5]|uniref:DUF7344 domain-containing protein n=1 Tax=Halobacterium sp. R2-5 TaxID=2715751 RepID=UPI00141E1BDB|nr:hypothetical protein [Halobacterium sp. R2-5]NIC00980.1 hypothetical protein [Halobacterium sp. R2-5]